MNWLTGALAVLEKDVRLELRTRYAINTLLLFVISALLVVAIAVKNEPLSPSLRSVLLWVVILFSAIAGLSHAFVSEEERGTVLLLQLNAKPSSVLAGKLLFNLMLTFALNSVAALAFWVVIGFQEVDSATLIVILALGAIGLSGATTLLSAIIAKAVNRGPLFAVLSFPILVPLLLSVVNGTRSAIEGAGLDTVTSEVFTLIGYAGVLITASTLLFDYIWKD
ncbi:MAG TPA: heme exporter protein CcmB [Rhodothermales bacterium]|nr:heme exporter protein CcmB [Rhodothermales bacterium]